MEDRLSKYLRIIGNTLLGILLMILSLGLIFGLLRLMFGWLDQFSWFYYLYMMLILFFPFTFFVTVYLIFFNRTKVHPSYLTRKISQSIFIVFLISWVIFFIIDAQVFFKNGYTTIGKYYSYNMLFLTINVATIFMVGVFQALNTAEEQDWLEKHKG